MVTCACVVVMCNTHRHCSTHCVNVLVQQEMGLALWWSVLVVCVSAVMTCIGVLM
jgi:hypothetical protein